MLNKYKYYQIPTIIFYICFHPYMPFSVVFLHMLLLIMWSRSVSSKVYAGKLESSTLRYSDSWIYVDRMNLEPGQVKVEFWAYLQTTTKLISSQYKLNLLIIPDLIWDYQQQKKCKSLQVPEQLASKQQANAEKGVRKAKKHIIALQFRAQKNLTDKFSLSFQLYKETTYYFVVVDCEKSLVNQYFNKQSHVGIEVQIINNNKSYGADEAKYTWFIPILIIICSVLLYFLNKINHKTQEDTNWPVSIVKIIIWFHLGGLCLFYMGHLIYIASRGNFYALFSLFYLIASTISEVLVLALITFCAFGWMTTYKSNDNYYPLACFFGSICLILALLSKINDKESSKTHIYDSVTYDIILMVKIIGLCIFLAGIIKSNIENRKNGAFLTYISKLGFFGTYCYLAVALFILSSEYISKYNRWVPVFLTVQAFRLSQILIIVWQVINKHSIYNKFTLYGRSFMQHDIKYL